MNQLELVFFGICTVLVLVGGFFTVAARNPIRGAMGLLGCIVGIAGNYLMLSAEFLAAIQILVYAGAVVVLFLFVIMLLGPSATSGRDTRTWSARYLAAAVFLAASIAAVVLLARAVPAPTARAGQPTPSSLTTFPPAPQGLGTIEGVGKELFSTDLTPFELSGALLLVAVVGAVAVARGKQVDPTLLTAKHAAADAAAAPGAVSQPAAKESAS
jgi:NADH-quinone oxidoreductase subunit J